MNLKKNNPSKVTGLRRWALWAVLVCCIAGGGLALYATNLTLNIAKYGLGNTAGCSFNNWISCDTALASSYATVLGIPSAWWGFLFYLGTALTVIFAALGKNKDRGYAATAAVFILAFGAVLFSFYKAYHLVLLKTVCPFCISMYILNVMILALLVRALGLSDDEAGGFLMQYFKSALGRPSRLGFAPQPVLFSALAIALFSLGYNGFEKYGQYQQTSESLHRELSAHFEQKPVSLEIDSSAAVWGKGDGRLTIVEFSDFECPACDAAAFRFRDIINEYQNEVRFHFLNFPLDKAINPSVLRDFHVNAGLAARAGVCAQQHGDFWGYHDDLFRQQKKLSRKLAIDLARQRGWDAGEFAACMDDPATIRQVREEIDDGRIAGVNATPTFFINGRMVKSWGNGDLIRSIIREERKRAHELNGYTGLTTQANSEKY